MKHSIFAVCAAAMFVPAVASAGERPMVNVDCKPTGQKLVYHCMFDVLGMKTHQPVEGASFKVNADMTAMPMAHNVKPVEPKPVAGKTGTYEGQLELDMQGEWTLKMTFAKPVRDVVVKKLMFGHPSASMDHSKHGDHSTDTQ